MLGVWLILCVFLGLVVLMAAAVRNWEVEKTVRLKGRREGDKWIFTFECDDEAELELLGAILDDEEGEG